MVGCIRAACWAALACLRRLPASQQAKSNGLAARQTSAILRKLPARPAHSYLTVLLSGARLLNPLPRQRNGNNNNNNINDDSAEAAAEATSCTGNTCLNPFFQFKHQRRLPKGQRAIFGPFIRRHQERRGETSGRASE